MQDVANAEVVELSCAADHGAEHGVACSGWLRWALSVLERQTKGKTAGPGNEGWSSRAMIRDAVDEAAHG